MKGKELLLFFRSIKQRREFFSAASDGDLRALERLLASGTDVNAKNRQYHGYTALHFAVRDNNHKMADLLLQAGADANAQMGGKPPSNRMLGRNPQVWEEDFFGKTYWVMIARGATPLHVAAGHGHVKMARLLLDAGANQKVLLNGERGTTPIHLAVAEGHAKVVKILLDHGADPNTDWDDEGTLLLHAAASNGCESVAKVLVFNGADINRRTNNGHTPLHLLLTTWSDADSASPVMRLAKFLLKKGAEYTIHDVAAIGAKSRVRELIQHDPRHATARDEYGYTPLCDAIRGGRKEVVDLLLTFGVDLNAASDEEWNPLTLALRLDNRIEIMSRLLNAGADVNAVDSACGETLLHEAVNRNSPNTVRLLLEAGADPDAKNKFGHTPLSEALENEASAAKDLAMYTSMASIRTYSEYDFDETYKRSRLKQATEIVEMLKE
ncbi:MAG: ankyrin repeat domain-containing protein [Candidatus Methanospirareceae archaeon]